MGYVQRDHGASFGRPREPWTSTMGQVFQGPAWSLNHYNFGLLLGDPNRSNCFNGQNGRWDLVLGWAVLSTIPPQKYLVFTGQLHSSFNQPLLISHLIETHQHASVIVSKHSLVPVSTLKEDLLVSHVSFKPLYIIMQVYTVSSSF
jgi:hypothetical protein